MIRKLTISASEANRSFSKLLRDATSGAEITITSHGKAVAKIIPMDGAERDRERMKTALAKLQEQWEQAKPQVIGPWTRDDLYDRDW